jgi:hypothetical protein
MKSEIIVNPSGDTLTILEGKALDPKHPEKIKLAGNIESIGNFLRKRYGTREGKDLQQVDKDLAVVVANIDKMEIHLLLNPQNPFGTEVNAKLELTEDIKTFHINDGFEFAREDLIKLLRHSKRFFADPLKHEEILNSYMKLNLTGETKIVSESDNRGNRDLQFKKNIQSQNIPTGFLLHMPIFKGQPHESFRVEICLNVSDASVRFWFESPELTDMIAKRKDEIFTRELESCQDFVIIHK